MLLTKRMYVITPHAQTSQGGPYRRDAITSGATYLSNHTTIDRRTDCGCRACAASQPYRCSHSWTFNLARGDVKTCFKGFKLLEAKEGSMDTNSFGRQDDISPCLCISYSEVQLSQGKRQVCTLEHGLGMKCLKYLL